MTRRWAGQRKSGMTRLLPIVSGTLTSGGWNPAPTRRSEDRVLQLASRGCRAGGEDLGEVRAASAWAEAVEGVEDLADGDELSLRLADGSS